MSANNKILITEKKNGWWFIYDVDMDTADKSTIGAVGSLDKALKMAKDYMSENIVEYGLSIEKIND